jgi:DNA-binding MarR family transcriptional regulator
MQARFNIILNSLNNQLLTRSTGRRRLEASSFCSIADTGNGFLNMRIEAFLHQSPMFAVKRAARHFEALAAAAFAADDLGFTEGLVLAATFFEAPRPIRPSQLAETFGTTRGNVSHAISSLEAKGLVQRKIDPTDARGYLLALRPPGKKSAMRVIAAFDRMQRAFEQKVGKASLAGALEIILALESCGHG